MSTQDYLYEKKAWKEGRGNVSGSHYVLDTVLFHESEDSNFRQRMKWLSNRIDGRTLDIGCNAGGLSMYLSQFINANYIAIDFIEEAIEEAKKQQENIRTGNLEGWCHIPTFIPDVCFMTMDALNMDFPPESFYTIIVSELIEHIPSETIIGFIRDTYNLLKKSGKLLITTPVDYINPPNDPGHPFMYKDILIYSLGIFGEDNLSSEEKWGGGTKTLYIEATK
jgi:SAM-dependent methyltransferase